MRRGFAELVPVRHARMLGSPFSFFRGAAGVMAADLAATPATGVAVQACGDMHVSNFGVFGSAERNLVFGINDFDETMPGPWEWDVKRLATSVVVATRFLGVDAAEARAAAQATVASYRDRIRELRRARAPRNLVRADRRERRAGRRLTGRQEGRGAHDGRRATSHESPGARQV